jgi:hypothetical protein
MRNAGFRDVLSPTLIGFTGLALLGLPGELVPSLHDRAPNKLTMASQMGVWTVRQEEHTIPVDAISQNPCY